MRKVSAIWQLLVFLLVVPIGAITMLRLFANRGDSAPALVTTIQLPQLISDLKAANPDYIVIGDSMLTTRMDPEPISQLSGLKFYFYPRGGGSSAAWYLYIKNVVLQSGVHPRAIIFFFRNQYLTWPRFRVDGLYRANVDRVRSGDDPLVTRLLLTVPPENWDAVGWMRRWLVEPGGLLYSKTASSTFHTRVEYLALDLTSFGEKKDDRKIVMADRFNLASLRSDLAAELPEAGSALDDLDDARPRTFDPSPLKSFLPHIIALGRENQIPLVFFRVKCRPGADNIRRQPAEMVEYIKNLKTYLEQQGCVFYDETLDPKVTLSMYQDGDHISDAAKPWWTNYFWERMKDRLP